MERVAQAVKESSGLDKTEALSYYHIKEALNNLFLVDGIDQKKIHCRALMNLSQLVIKRRK